MIRTLFPAYSIKVSSIQEFKSDSKDKVTVNSLIDKLTAFELNSFDNSVPIDSKFYFESRQPYGKFSDGGPIA